MVKAHGRYSPSTAVSPIVHLFGGLKDVLSSDRDTASKTGYATTTFSLGLIMRFGGQILNQWSSGLNDFPYDLILFHFLTGVNTSGMSF